MNLRDRDNLRREDKGPVPKVSSLRRFNCSQALLLNVFYWCFQPARNWLTGSDDALAGTHAPQVVHQTLPSSVVPRVCTLVLSKNYYIILCTYRAPSEPRNVRVSDVGQRSATVSWDPPTNTFSNPLTDVSAYRVTASQNVIQDGNHVATEEKLSRKHKFTNLEEFTNYSFSVSASNTFGYGAASEPKEATTLQAGRLVD